MNTKCTIMHPVDQWRRFMVIFLKHLARKLRSTSCTHTQNHPSVTVWRWVLVLLLCWCCCVPAHLPAQSTSRRAINPTASRPLCKQAPLPTAHARPLGTQRRSRWARLKSTGLLSNELIFFIYLFILHFLLIINFKKGRKVNKWEHIKCNYKWVKSMTCL